MEASIPSSAEQCTIPQQYLFEEFHAKVDHLTQSLMRMSIHGQALDHRIIWPPLVGPSLDITAHTATLTCTIDNDELRLHCDPHGH